MVASDQNPMGADQQPGPATGAFTFTYSELNVLQTIVAIVACFVVCWAPASIANIVQTFAVRRSFSVT